jgi:hypothetical protein
MTDNKFRPKNILTYPPENNQTFEEYFYYEFIKKEHSIDRLYLPIFWTNYYISKNYGNGDLSELQSFIDNLDKAKKYFTIVQYDDNIINNLNDLDILIFAQGGYGNYEDKTYPIPLNCQSNSYNYEIKEKDIFCSFVGRKTHEIRNIIFDLFKNHEEYYISESMDYNTYRKLINRSKFSMCPRGYGLTSFRICESLHNNSIPVYIYDELFLPFNDLFNFEDIGILIHKNELDKTTQILKSKTDLDINNYLLNGKKIYNDFFSFYGCYNKILSVLNNYKN